MEEELTDLEALEKAYDELEGDSKDDQEDDDKDQTDDETDADADDPEADEDGDGDDADEEDSEDGEDDDEEGASQGSLTGGTNLGFWPRRTSSRREWQASRQTSSASR